MRVDVYDDKYNTLLGNININSTELLPQTTSPNYI